YAAGFFGIAAVAGLALSAVTYLNYTRETRASERDDQVNAKMVELLLVDDLIHLVNENQIEKVKLRLNDKVTEHLAAIDSLQPTAEEPTKALATFVSGRIIHARKQHPEIYPGTAQPAVSGTTKVAQVADH
ncbi:MAG: hypothetical protein JWR69_527, partial [Pedosphaera sp.]|nr:hypothetical protein [Pedosphaera sp.]